ncbi:TRAP transporter substrate-binding protein [Variovorax sp. Root473]|uniref:TRAP transporter substrate-binding protein n=1 Tax=Variovorax sp. Root473 TaxID=1736541 RepID=UPI0006F27DC5|nr:TRAP transporter substrate-binding protein [Variovorax sp. Root473]KQX95089.1 ABC transporter substrate-binding protein [Variovorax sp. Root473]
MPRKLPHRLAATCLVLTSFLMAGLAGAQNIQERNFKFAFVNQKEHPQGMGAQRFSEIVEKKSDGKMKVRLFPSGVLGGDASVISSLQGGTVEMTMAIPGLLSGMARDFSVFDLPFLFNNEKEADLVLDGPVGRKLLDKLPERGLIGLTYFEHGFRNVTNSRRPVARMEDLQGLKLRVMQIPVMIDAFGALGANPSPLPLPEVYTALEQRAVDGQENPYSLVEASKYYEIQKYGSDTKHVFNPVVLLFSKKVWDKLSEDERKVLLDAARETQPFQRAANRDVNARAAEFLKGKGMVLTEFPAAERERLRDKLKPVTDKYVRQIDPALTQELFSELGKARGTTR